MNSRALGFSHEFSHLPQVNRLTVYESIVAKNRSIFIVVTALAFTVAAQAQNIIQNGDFSLGNTNFVSGYTYVPYDYGNYTNTPQVVPGDYTVGTNVPPSYSDWSQFHTVSGGSTQMLIVNGAADATESVWSQIVEVLPNTPYMISFYIAEIGTGTTEYSGDIAVDLGGDQIGNGAASSVKDTWKQYSFSWNSGSNTSVSLALKDLQTSENYNDFAVDNISMVSVQPGIASISLSGTNLVFEATNGQSGATYFVLTSTNLTMPFSKWTPVATNVLNASGNFTVIATNTVTQNIPQSFYILEMQ